MNKPAGNAGYQIMLATLLSINFGIVFFDRNASNFLMPFIQPELGMSNSQVGMLAGALSLTWAIAAFCIGLISDKMGSRKGLLILATIAFSACSFLSGIASSFAMMLGARLLMGVAEGGIMPLSQALVVAAFAASFGWRHSFFLAGAPGLLMALLIWLLVKEAPAKQTAASPAAPQISTVREALADRNVVLCAIIGVLLVSYLTVCWAFMPLYLTQVRKLDTQTESWLMGTLGISATIGAFAISALSDRVGRRPLLIIMPLIAVVLPLGAMFYDGSVWGLAALFFVGWGVNGVFPLFMGTVPSESVAPHHMAMAMGICMGMCEFLGGVLAPSLAGIFADSAGLNAPLWLMLGVTVVAALLALGLRETAPRVLARRAAAPGAHQAV
jgi:MFS transporter, ACS family, hexuronate transporter